MATGVRAVQTTGIYCRPECSATPRPENVTGYPSAAAAEAAGFRACHRCRPYRSSEPPAWVDGPELVCRAVRLVVDGALDDGGGEAGLAARLGVSARHLRRLFGEHVGATPDQLARSRRAHFARRLLDDTDLPMSVIAHAAGFGSLRQMNRVVHDTFRGTPTELRARRLRADRLVADGGLDLRLPYRPPLAWDELLAYLAARAIPGVETVDGGVYRRTIRADGQPGVIEVRPGDGHHLLVRVHLPRWHGLIHLVDRARRLFALDVDPAAVLDALGGDPVIGPSVRRRPGVRPAGAWDSFEVGVRVILGQQVSVAGASTLAGRLVQAIGEPVPGLAAWGLTHCFPTPGALAAADLAGLGLPRQRAGAVQAFAAAADRGGLPLDGAASLEALTGALVDLPGIGPWTAHAIALRLGERDAWPAGDLVLRTRLGGGAPVTEQESQDHAARWRPWRAFAAVHLWSASSGDETARS